MENDFQKLLTNQFLICGIIKKNIDIVNYLMQCFNNRKILGAKYHFLLFTTHIHYQYAVINLCALFESKDSTQKNNFYLYNKQHIKQFIAVKTLSKVNNILKRIRKHTKVISNLRNQQYAHKDMNEQKIEFHIEDNLPIVNELTNAAMQILLLFGGYEFFEDDEVLSLKHLIETNNSK